ncbi:MAG: hypothetical protein H0U76_18900 [Ktedonobacteraceae bacterium]|nr:hypothetical protein [Ktedonobacteraceae bacterium]MBA3823679.1 hypothetical protein [Ktedonobacterales bacterium]
MSHYIYCQGALQLNHQLTPAHHAYLQRFAEIRLMKRHVEKIVLLPDPLREAVGLSVGPEGAFYTGDSNDAETIADANHPPEGQRDLYCPWHPSEDRMRMEPASCINNWENSYAHWMSYLIQHFLGPWGYSLSGRVAVRFESEEISGYEMHMDENVWRSPPQFVPYGLRQRS